MSYYDVSQMSYDPDLLSRVQACAAEQGAQPDPYDWAAKNMLVVCSAPGWGDKWASALAGDVPNPGRDQAVISDGDILSAVQPLISP